MPPGTDRTAAVTVTIARDPALVRAVRLVAASVARRAGRDEELVEEVRLAAGEACALFLGDGKDKARAPGTADRDPVQVRITIDDDAALSVDVSTTGPVEVQDHPDSDLEGIESWALLRGLIDDFAVFQGSSQTTVSMRWPLG